MNENGIEDILIGGEYNNKKKKKKGFVVVFLILILILLAMCAAYWYFTNQQTSKRELFVQNLSNANINKLLQNDVYSTISNKVLSNDSKITSNINFSTTLEIEELEGIDLSKIDFELYNTNDIDNSKSYGELEINYSGNEIFKSKLLSTDKAIAISSDEIHDKYIGVHLDKIEEVFDINYDVQKINNLKTGENINISTDEMNEYVKKYLTEIIKNIPEEKFSIKENIVIQKDSGSVDVTAYSLTLSQEELNNLLIKLLENVKNDEELLERITSKSNQEEQNIEESENITSPENQLSQDVPAVDNNVSQEEVRDENLNNSQEEILEEPVQNTVENQIDSSVPVITINPVASIIEPQSTSETAEQLVEEPIAQNVDNNTQEEVDNGNVENDNQEEITNQNTENNGQEEITTENAEDINQEETTQLESTILKINKTEENEIENINNFSDLLELLLGKKLNISVLDLQKEIDDIIEVVKKLEGNGITINIYASSENTEKINIVLPDNSTIDLEYIINPENENETGIKIIYLYKLENLENDNNEENKSSGFSLELNKSQKEANTTIKAVYSFIENEKINKKITLNLKTDGTVNSKEFNNDIVVTFSTNEGETKAIIDNTISFSDVTEEQTLNEENCLYLDLLPPEELNTTKENLKNQTISVYNNKKENLNFIDTNTGATLDNISSNVTREEAKAALINKVSLMMGEAIERGEEFTIQNLVDFKIDGYEVSSNVTPESAIIVVDVYTFNIDSAFTLTDVE